MRSSFLAAAVALMAAPACAGTVLFVGDSHSVGPFGWKVDELLREAGHATATYASCGSIAQWWVSGKATPCGYSFRDLEGRVEKGQKGPTPVFAALLAKVKHSVAVVELGANYAGNPSDEHGAGAGRRGPERQARREKRTSHERFTASA